MTDRVDERTLAAARVWATDRFPYLATALFATQVVAAPGTGGAGVDRRWRLLLDPAVAADWSPQDLGATLVHHVGHLLREHGERAKAAGVTEDTARRWTRACDAEIDDDLVEAGVTPPGRLVLPEDLGGERGRMAEEYYALDGAEGGGDAHRDHGSGADGLPRRGEDDGDDGISEHEAELVRRRVAEAIRQAVRERGDVPRGWQRWASDLLDPKVDWRRALAAEIRRSVQRHSGRVDYSYRRPSRRATASPGVVLPSMEHPVPEVAVVVDTSGSMDEAHLDRVLAEIDGLLAAIGVRSSGVRVLAVDADVHAITRVTASRQVVLAGGGGTDMARGITAAAQLRPRPAVVVVLTDGYTPWPVAAPKGIAVVIALLEAPGSSFPPPAWARVVHVDPAA